MTMATQTPLGGSREMREMTATITDLLDRFRKDHLAELDAIPNMKLQLEQLTEKQAEYAGLFQKHQGEFISEDERKSLAQVPTLDAAITEMRAMVESIASAETGSADQIKRIDNLTDNYAILLTRLENTDKEMRKRSFNESQNTFRIHAPNSPYNNMNLKQFAYSRMVAPIAKGYTDRDISRMAEVSEKLKAPTPDEIEAHFDALNARRPLDRYLRWQRDSLLGRHVGDKNMENYSNNTSSIPTGAQRLDAAVTTADDSARDIIPTMINAEFWQDVVMVEESIANRIESVPMLSDPFKQPLIGSSMWNDVTAQDETSQRIGGDARAFASTMYAGSGLHGMEFISEAVLEDQGPSIDMELEERLPEVMAEAIDKAIMMGDSDASASTNVNGVAYNGATNGRIPELLGWNGMVKAAHAGTDLTMQAAPAGNAAGALSSTNAMGALNRLRNLLGRAALRPGSWVFVTPMSERQAIRDNVTAYQRQDAVGILSTLVGGDLPIYMSGEVISPEGMPQAWDDNGKISSTVGDNTHGAVLAFAPMLAKIGHRVQPTVYVQNPAGGDPPGMWLHTRARPALGLRGWNSQTGAWDAGANRPGRAPVALLHNITR